MSELSQVGIFKGVIVESTVGVTNKKKLPQFVATLKVTARYDKDEGVWEDWTEFEEQTIIGYFVLTTLDEQGRPEECYHYDAVMEAVGWDGQTYSSLSAGNYAGKTVAFQVIENDYDGQVTLKVSKIGPEDAQFSGLRKISETELKNLDARFAVKKHTAAKPSPTPKKKAAAETPAAKPPTKKKPPTPGKKKVPSADAKPCTAEEAYTACWEANEKLDDAHKVPEEILDDYWASRVAEHAKDPDDITPVEAAKIRDAVLSDIEIPF